MSTFSLGGFGRRTRLRGGAPGAGFRMRRAGRSRTGTICATGVSRSRTAIVSPRRTARIYSLSRAFSSAIPTCLMTHYDHKWSSTATAAHRRPILGEPSTGPIRDKAASWTCPSRVEDNDRAGRDDERSGRHPASPTTRPKLMAHPRRGIRAGTLRNRRLATASRVDSARWCAWRSFSSCCCWWSSPAVPSSLPLRRARRSCCAPCPRRFVINSGSRHAPPVSTTGPARSASRCTPSTSGNPPRRVRSSTRSAWRSTSPPPFSAEPSCSAGSMSPGPKSCSTPQRKVRPRLRRLTHYLRNRSLIRHPGRAGARSRAHVRQSKRHARRCSRALAVVHRRRARSRAGSGRRCRVGGPSGAERRRSASIGHGRTCHWPERRWPSRRSRWSRRWRRSAGPRTSTSAAAISM